VWRQTTISTRSCTRDNQRCSRWSKVRHPSTQLGLAHVQLLAEMQSRCCFAGGERNRLATLLWYMAAPDQGGETHFPRAGGLDIPQTFKCKYSSSRKPSLATVNASDQPRLQSRWLEGIFTDRAEGDAEAGTGNTVLLAAAGTRPARPQHPPICAVFGSFTPQLWLTVSRNLSAQDGAPDPFSLHGGCPPEGDGKKWAVNKWVWSKAY
jgi:hypothetical protein